LTASAELRRKVSDIVELNVTGQTQVINLIQVLQKIGLEKIKEKATRSLSEFRPACYYGCLLTRPPQTLKFDDCEQPSSMETILRALGAEPVDWNMKTECCGAGMTMSDEGTVLELSHKILCNAKEHGANCLVVACPMCHVNLDMKQPDVDRRYGCSHDMVVYYLSDLVGLALGIGEQTLGIDRHFITKR
jgi:heterodisulfide reductase subunit B